MSIFTTPIVLVPGSPEWRVVHEALAQYVENHRDFLDMQDDDKSPVDVKKHKVAEAVMESFDSVYTALAEIPSRMNELDRLAQEGWVIRE